MITMIAQRGTLEFRLLIRWPRGGKPIYRRDERSNREENWHRGIWRPMSRLGAGPIGSCPVPAPPLEGRALIQYWQSRHAARGYVVVKETAHRGEEVDPEIRMSDAVNGGPAGLWEPAGGQVRCILCNKLVLNHGGVIKSHAASTRHQELAREKRRLT